MRALLFVLITARLISAAIAEDSPPTRPTRLPVSEAPVPSATPAEGAPETKREPGYFPPPESQGGWRRVETPDAIRTVGGMDPQKLDALHEWLLKSDDRPFAAVVIRHGTIVLQVERGNSAVSDARRVASVSKAVGATVLAIASEWSQEGRTPRKMTFDDPAFDFLPWAQPLSDPRKAVITVGQLLNHTSGICPEATGAPNDGSWEYILGHTGDSRTERLAFEPGHGCGYSTHALAHAALVCETVTGKPYDQFAIEALFKPLGIEHWWFQYYEGGPGVGRHPSHGLGMPARDLARIAYCMLRDGRWADRQVIPQWFVRETAAPTHEVTSPEMRWKLNPQVFSHGWELPSRHDPASGRSGAGIPPDARSKPGSGGQLIAFVPSLDLVVTRQTGSSGDWQFEEYLRLACAAVLPDAARSSARVGERWEHVLTAIQSYAHPYADVTVRVAYRGPGGQTMNTFGFWDGGNTFRIRCAFPTPGVWQWETECSKAADSGLHQQRGLVEVLPYKGDNPLQEHGFLKVSDNRRYLTHRDGTPFLWMGDTAWSAPHRSTEEEWDAYLADRVAKHFTVIQVAPAPLWAGPTDREGRSPFADPACSQLNPAYWQSFDRKVQRANAAGLVLMLVGLMEPVRRYPEADQACRFARHIVSRLFANSVVFSPSFDSNFMPLANEVGRAARQATDVHLITQHPGTPWNQPTPTFSLRYYDEPYLDFAGLQTGHNGGHLDWCAHHAIEWTRQLYAHEPHKPVVNLEAMYDAQGQNGWRAVDARSLGWRSWLSGACGYTYGAGDTPPKIPQGGGGLWKWVTDPAKYDYWKKALQWDSATQMTYLHDFLAAIEWWRLQPAQELIHNQPDDVTRRRVLAKAADGAFAVAYLPESDAVTLDLSSFPAPLSASWFDPVKGTTTSLPDTVANAANRRFEPPAEGDWVLLLKRT